MFMTLPNEKETAESSLIKERRKSHHFKIYLIISSLFIVLLAMFFLVRIVLEKMEISSTERAEIMGTDVAVVVNGPNARANARGAIGVMRRLEKLLGWKDPQSEVALINSMAGITSVAVSKDCFDVISRSIKFSMSLGGAFDITMGPLMETWDFSFRERRGPPPKIDIINAKKLVNYRNVELNPELETVKLERRGMKIDLGAVGKGYAISKARNYLVSRGVKSALINMGSSITSIGRRPDGKFWRVGIKHPRKPGQLLGIVTLNPGQAISTSGDYEKYFMVDGKKRYHHIVDPRTGYPAEYCQAVTIIAGDATVADILSTTVFVKGPTAGMRLINSLEGIKGIIVKSDGTVVKSSGLDLEKAD